MLTYFPSGTGSSLYHELIGAELIEPLMVGATYYVSFYINAAAGGSEWPMSASSHYGALFTTEAEVWEVGMAFWPARNFAHVYHPEVMSDTAAWFLVSGSFVADSAYRYMVLGNHFDNTYTEADTIIIQDSTAYLYRAYTFVDQVCVSLDPMGCPLAQSLSEQEGGSLLFYPNPAVRELIIAGLQPRAHVRVYDAVGRSLWEGLSQGAQLELDVSPWGRGLYTAVIQDEQGIRSKKFVLIE
ncbi:MAG: T9SS type A sorting domain-containing protein [Flavobacteriales bacterium]|nr:T9SS type A sorting domain-containing protein [Flavobacteriales bacterium]